MAKKKAATKEPMPTTAVKSFDLTPNLSPEQTQQFAEAVDRKDHMGYICYMLLRALNQRVPLHQLIKIGIQRELVDEDVLKDFFGDRDADEEVGCCEAEGHTIESALDGWQKAQDDMMRAISQAGRAAQPAG